MIYDLGKISVESSMNKANFDKLNLNKMGNKAKELHFLKNIGVNVPGGFILDVDVFDEIISYNDIEEELINYIDDIKESKVDDLEEVSKEICSLFNNVAFPEEISCKINTYIKDDKKYAVRSSGTKEDLDDHSFAGMYETFLNVEGKKGIKEAIIKCYRSLFSVNVLTYLKDNKIEFDELKMGVVVQEMVDSQYSGVMFTINPITGKDTEIVMDVVEGLGNNYVDGKSKPETYYYDWFVDEYRINKNNRMLNKEVLEKLSDYALKIQLLYGKPCDIEYGIVDGNVFILQVRSITKINYGALDRVWTTANFKDGGVSSRACHRFMYSLYEYVWQRIMGKYLIAAKLRTKKQVPKRLINMFYGKVYWDLTTVKTGVSMIPGYKEREFDSEYSIEMNYEGDGDTTEYNFSSLKYGIKILLAQSRIVKKLNKNMQSHIDKCMNIFKEYEANIDKDYSLKDLENKWTELIKEYYLDEESTYFWQIYVNTVEQSIHKNYLLKYADEMEYLDLLGGMNDISHMRSFTELWNISRFIVDNDELYKAFKAYTNKEIVEKILKNDDESYREFNDKINEYLEKYGYHSEREIDVTYPSFREKKEDVIKVIKEYMELDEEQSPFGEKHDRYKIYREKLSQVKGRMSKGKYKKYIGKLNKIRMMLWNREELKDMSTRFYYIIRIYTMKLAGAYVEKGILEKNTDIWQLELDDICGIINGQYDAKYIKEKVTRNTKYYNSFINYENDNEIGTVKRVISDAKASIEDKYIIKGVGCNSGVVTAKARVIKDISQLDTVEKGDILIAKYTDTGWTPKFAKLAGIVTEFGGILCHAAVVSREYGIPCIVCAHNALKKIKDGDMVTIDGMTGKIIINK
ncbi:MAG: phosphoenolpyruvate synthase [Lachnospiraceae bacterium]|nr:phosphoenolpyruvate synthase [Lachnospiraceae bacterium]